MNSRFPSLTNNLGASRALRVAWHAGALLCFSLLASQAALPTDPGPAGFPLVTNLHQLRQFALKQGRGICSVNLTAVVRSADAAGGGLVLEDAWRAELLALGLSGSRFAPGDRVRLEAQACSVALGPLGLLLGKAAVVNNDGHHPMLKQSGEVYLERGLHPLRLLWFNRRSRLGLNVRYKGPGMDYQTIPGSALFRADADPAAGRTNIVQGLDYRCFEGSWPNLAGGFSRSQPVKSGHTPDFALNVRTRDELVGLEFSGYLEIAREGLYTFETESDDGSLLFIAEAPPRLVRLDPAALAAPRPLVASQTLAPEDECQWAEVDGLVTFVNETSGGLELELRADSRRMKLAVADAAGLDPHLLLHRRIRATGVSRGAESLEGPRVLAMLAVLSAADLHLAELEPSGTEDLPLLTSCVQVKRLSREQAQRGKPVRLRGVITRAVPGYDTLVLQDATHGLFVRALPRWSSGAPQFGEYWEIEGETAPGDFAPVLNWRQGRRLGVGRLPEPVAATWDRLMSGSLDTQYVEIQGIVAGVGPSHLELLLREGKIRLGFLDREPGTLGRFENARIRVRGCLFPAWNAATHRIKAGEMNISSESISVEEAAPSDLFAIPLKRAVELQLFDPAAGAFQRVKVAGQFLCRSQGHYFMNDGTDGVRFQPRDAPSLRPGDRLEVVGFLELGGPSPVLREARVRPTGHALLPEPQPLLPEGWLDPGHDATRVSIEGVLVNRRTEPAGPVLELQSGLRSFVARLSGKEPLPRSLPLGSRVSVTGIYAAQGANPAPGRGIDAFELWLSSAADLRVLARPPVLTLPRVLAALGVVGAILLGALLWALSLRHRVQVQTAIIRQQAQHEAALEERARIAKDIHDDVGASLTSILMLGQRFQEDLAEPRALAALANKIVTNARATVQALDEIVWAVNPRNDTLDALAGYVSQYASQFFENTEVRCRLDVPEKLSSLMLPTEIRHDLFLVVKEALNNVLKHAHASEVALQVVDSAGVLQLTLEDNGRGFDVEPVNAHRQGDGLKNMRKRMEKLGGRFSLTSRPGQGTKLKLTLTLGKDLSPTGGNSLETVPCPPETTSQPG